jgi:hypothetical protein
MVITGKNIEIYRLLTLKQALKLEINPGLQRSGRSAYSLIKEEFNLKGSKAKVLEQFNQIIQEVTK